MTVNFKESEGLEIVHKLIRDSDILVENFISGKLAAMGLGYEDCKKINPKLIYVSITGLYVPTTLIRGLSMLSAQHRFQDTVKQDPIEQLLVTTSLWKLKLVS